jgi:glycosyltransferase involved in cell wall biosynthesis
MDAGYDRPPLLGGQTIGLCMIVRDEAEVIERCLASVAPLIDHWTICDTGSLDRTPELIEAELAEVPGTLYRRPWRDFGTNRSELLELARGSADYLLLIDADMTLVRSGEVERLGADVYLLRHLGPLDYSVPRLVRGDLRHRYEGATHEYLVSEGAAAPVPLAGLAIDHHGDGGTRGEKIERDLALLEAAVARDPGDARAVFYLAQTYADDGQDERAIEHYRRRVELGGWEEEYFYAALRAGQLQARRDPDGAVAALRAAAAMRPTRAEPLLELARIARLRRRYEEAHRHAEAGLAIPYPSDLLFVHRDVYEWRLRFERAVAAYWLGRHAEAIADCDRLLAAGRLPADAEAAVLDTRRYAVSALAVTRTTTVAPGMTGEAGATNTSAASPGISFDGLDRLVPEARFAELRLDLEPDWPAFNPSIAAEGEGFAMVVRSANYRILDGRYEFLTDPEPGEGDSIRTLNYLARLGPDLDLREVVPLEDAPDREPVRHPGPVRGYEDCRLFHLDGRRFALATVRDRNPAAVCEIALLALDGEWIERVTVLPGPTSGRHEKNWMPFVDAAGLGIVYGCGPTVVYRCEVERGALGEASVRAAPAWATGIRGGSQGVPVEGGFLFCVHEVLFDQGRRYLHRFVRLDSAGLLDAASRRFTLAGRPIELCAGMARRGEDLVLSFGIDDAAAALAVVPVEAALDLLEPV